MPSLAVTATSTTELKLKPQVKRKLLTELKAYAELKAQRDALDHAMRSRRENVETMLYDTGETSLTIDGYKATVVAGVKKKLNQKKLIAQGVTQAQIEAATEETLNKPYVKITAPGARNDDDNDY